MGVSYRCIFIIAVTTRDCSCEIAAFVTTERFDEASFYSNYVRECTRVTVLAIIGASGYWSEERRGMRGREEEME